MQLNEAADKGAALAEIDAASMVAATMDFKGMIMRMAPGSKARAHCDPMEPDRRCSFLVFRIFCDEPVSTSSENALATKICEGRH